MKRSLLLFAMVSLLSSCDTNQNPKIHGSWQGIGWEINDQPSGRDFNSVAFEFKADDTYEGSFGAQKEVGIYRLSIDDKLYTTETGKIEKAVEVEMPSSDTLIFWMNRQGEKEKLTLVRK